MDNNSGETPNPLNPSPTKAPEVGSTTQAQQVPKLSPTTAPVSATMVSATTQVASLDPTGRTMEQNIQAPVPPKKTNKWLIVAIIAGCVVLVGGIIAAALMIANSKKTDAVAVAVQKIISGDAPENIAIDGNINISLNDRSIPIKQVDIDLNSKIIVNSMINASSAALTLTDNNDQNYSINLNEIYASSNDLYFKIDGVKKVIEDPNFLNILTGNTGVDTNCIEDESGTTNCETVSPEKDCAKDGECDATTEKKESESSASLINDTIMNIIDTVDGVYYRISADELDSIKNESSGLINNANCVPDLIGGINRNANSLVQLYNKHPFIASTDEKVSIPSKQNPIYRVWLEGEQFATFVNEIQSADLSKTLDSCLGWKDNSSITEADVSEITDRIPPIYVEVDSDNNFTRLYTEKALKGSNATIRIDLGFSYPVNVNVSEPLEYKNFSEFMQKVFRDIYDLEDSAGL